MSLFGKKNVDEELKDSMDKEIKEKDKFYKIILRIHWMDGDFVDYWFNDIPAKDLEGKNVRQWFKPFFKWFFHTREEYYYQASDKAGLGMKRNNIKFFEIFVEE